jgi:hypothetical protein
MDELRRMLDGLADEMIFSGTRSMEAWLSSK